MKLDYLLLDVFTQQPLAGNQLAVVPRADGLLDSQMQAIAREFNLSETVFIFAPVEAQNTASVRIFTPHTELPFAGHPTVGAAVALGLQAQTSTVRLEEKVGLITAQFEKANDRAGAARFGLPRLPARLADLTDIAGMAQALGLTPEDIGCGAYRPAVFSAGVTFHLVPVRNAEVLRHLKVDQALFDAVFSHDHNSAYVFTLTPDEPANDLAARMFGMNIGEDPGTGSAAAALIGLLAERAPATGQTDYVLRQGHEMGRPCRITLSFTKENGQLLRGGIGGHAVIVGEGVLYLPD